MHGADPDTYIKRNYDHHGYGWSALHAAAVHNHREIAELLLKHGATVDGTDPGDNTPLLVAVAKGHLSLVRVLLNHGANMNTPNRAGVTPFLRACDVGDVNILYYILRNGFVTPQRDVHLT